MNSVGQEHLPPAEIESIVQRATRARAKERLSFCGIGVRQAAAVSLVAVLLSAGVSVSLWPDPTYSSGRKGKAPLSFTAATAMLTDLREPLKFRRVSLARVYTRLKVALRRIAATAAGSGDVAQEAKATLERLRALLKDPKKAGPAGAAQLADYAAVCERITDSKLSASDRREALRAAEAGFASGLESLVQAAVTDSPELGDARDLYLGKLRRLAAN